ARKPLTSEREIAQIPFESLIKENNLRSFFSWLVQAFGEFNNLTFKEINKIRNCHFVNYGTKIKVIKFFEEHARKKEVKLFVSEANLYQLAIPNTEIRLIGDLQPNYFHAKEKSYNDLFSVLFIDFDHSLHKNI
ncbi:1332_t:CDS:2, partial [Cetraspora pellucida]